MPGRAAVAGRAASSKSAAAARTRPVAIVALDFPDTRAALRMVDVLGDGCGFYKVGSELFTAAGPQVVQTLRALGKEVFLDLKFHDIPNTVRGAARSAASLGASLITVHASGGKAMIEAAVEGAGQRCRVLGVTVLTSLDSATLRSATGRKTLEVSGEVLRLAGECLAAGAYGVVSSGLEAKKIHAKYGEKLKLLVPGIRAAPEKSDGAKYPRGSPARADDQKRTVTAAEAARAGASYIVLGRMLTEAPDPRSVLAAALKAL